MNLGENATSRWEFPAYFQVPEQSSSGFVDRFIRLKTTYWNRGYAIVLLALIGLTITSYQSLSYYKFIESVLEKNSGYYYLHSEYTSYYQCGYYVGLIPGGVLATVYPAHNVLGISVTLSSVGHLISAMCVNYLNARVYCCLRFCTGTTMATVSVAVNTVWTYWVPLDKQSIRHVPLILYSLIRYGGYLHESVIYLLHTYSSEALTISSGVIGLAWYVLWLCAINGNRVRSLNRDLILYGGSKNPLYSFRTPGVSLVRSIVSDIPWKSMCTSTPVLAIAFIYVCDVRLVESKDDDDFVVNEMVEFNLIKYVIILLLLFVVLVELVPEIIASISTTNVRKFWSCSYFSSMGIFFFLEAILGNIFRTNKMCYYALKGLEYLVAFGFINYLDIAPKYGSLLNGFLLTIRYISQCLWDDVSIGIHGAKILNEVETGVLMMIICLAVSVLYAIYGSAALQPWAADEPVEENQQNMVENENKPYCM